MQIFKLTLNLEIELKRMGISICKEKWKKKIFKSSLNLKTNFDKENILIPLN